MNSNNNDARAQGSARPLMPTKAPHFSTTNTSNGSGSRTHANESNSDRLLIMRHARLSSAVSSTLSNWLPYQKTFAEKCAGGQITSDVAGGCGGHLHCNSLPSLLKDTRHPFSSDTYTYANWKNEKYQTAKPVSTSNCPTLYSSQYAPESSARSVSLSQALFGSPPTSAASLPVAQLPNSTHYSKQLLSEAVCGGGGHGVEMNSQQPIPSDSLRYSCGSRSYGVCCADCRARGWQVCRLPPIDTILPPREWSPSAASGVQIAHRGRQASVAPGGTSSSQTLLSPQAMQPQPLLTGAVPEPSATDGSPFSSEYKRRET